MKTYLNKVNYMKYINGTWIEIHHFNIKEGKYFNPVCHEFSDEQWKEKIRELASLNMKYIVLMGVAITNKEDYTEVFYPSKHFKKWDEIKANDPVDAILSEANKYNMKVFVGAGTFGYWADVYNNMTSLLVHQKTITIMKELYELYGHYDSFYGWYYPDETGILGHFENEFIDYVKSFDIACFANPYSAMTKPIYSIEYGEIVSTCDLATSSFSEVITKVKKFCHKYGIKFQLSTPSILIERDFDRVYEYEKNLLLANPKPDSLIINNIGYFWAFINDPEIKITYESTNKIYDERDYFIPGLLGFVGELLYSFLYYMLFFLLRGKLELPTYFIYTILPRSLYTVLLTFILYPAFHGIHRLLLRLEGMNEL